MCHNEESFLNNDDEGGFLEFLYDIFIFLTFYIIKKTFCSAVIEWNKLDSRLWKAVNFTDFKKNIFSFIRPKANSVFNCNSSKGLKVLQDFVT